MSLLRMPEVVAKVGLSKSTIRRAVARGEFPLPRKFGAASLWVEAEIDAWIATLATTTPKEAA